MPDAFRCTRCGEYENGSPYVSYRRKSADTYVPRITFELCEDCYRSLSEWLGGSHA